MADFNHLTFCHQTLNDWLQRLQHPDFKIHLPKPLGRFKRMAGAHFHFHPELFLQMSGMTRFIFPNEKINLYAGEALLAPRGLPHGEIAHHWRGDFQNLVVMFPHDGVSIHRAGMGTETKPQVLAGEYFTTRKGSQIAQYLDDIEDLRNSPSSRGDPEVKYAIKSLFQAALAHLLLVVKQPHIPFNKEESPKIRECHIYIISHLYEPSLSVKKLAGQLHCSADYLSHLFAAETGQHLTEFIQQERMALAKHNLGNPTLSIKEIAWSCGYSDPSYFTRLFRRLSGKTPKSFRRKLNP